MDIYNQEIENSVILALTIVIITGISFYLYNKNKNFAEAGAINGQYTTNGNYQNMTPMKHDMFKQLTIDVVVLSVSLIVAQIFMGEGNWDDLLSVKSFRDFRSSVIGQSGLAAMGYLIYYQVIEPQVANRIPKF
jgi:hypothetical protein